MYGWTNDPCVEWYVVDDSYNNLPFNPGGSNFQIPQPDQVQTLAEGLEEVSFEYYGINTATGARTTNARAAWNQRWDATATQLPELIRINLQAGPAEQEWPELIIALPARAQS